MEKRVEGNKGKILHYPKCEIYIVCKKNKHAHKISNNKTRISAKKQKGDNNHDSDMIAINTDGVQERKHKKKNAVR